MLNHAALRRTSSVDASGIELPPEGLKSAGVTPRKSQLAKRLVDDMTEKWNPSQFKNTYHDDLMARIKEKIKAGQTKEITKPRREGTPRVGAGHRSRRAAEAEPRRSERCARNRPSAPAASAKRKRA